jgi:hypothetical protein
MGGCPGCCSALAQDSGSEAPDFSSSRRKQQGKQAAIMRNRLGVKSMRLLITVNAADLRIGKTSLPMSWRRTSRTSIPCRRPGVSFFTDSSANGKILYGTMPPDQAWMSEPGINQLPHFALFLPFSCIDT